MCTRLQGNTKLATMDENFEPRILFGNRFEIAVKRMVLADYEDLIRMLNDPSLPPNEIEWLIGMFNTNTGQELNRTLQLYDPPVRIHEEWTRESMSASDKILVSTIIENLPNADITFWQYSYGVIPYREPTSLHDYRSGDSSWNDLFDAVVEGIKLIKTDFRGFARHSGVHVKDIALILYNIQLALKLANNKGEFNYLDQIDDYEYNETSVLGPPH